MYTCTRESYLLKQLYCYLNNYYELNIHTAYYILGIDISTLNEKKNQLSTSIPCLRGNTRTQYYISDAPLVRYVEEL